MKIVLTTDLHFGFNELTHSKICKCLEDHKYQLEETKLMIITGDLISCKQSCFPRIFKTLRNFYSRPILIVCGNHDYWDFENRQFSNYENNRLKFRKECELFDITYLPDSPFFTEKFVFYGFDGWYHMIPPATNDGQYLPREAYEEEIHSYLQRKSYSDVFSIVQDSKSNVNINKKLVCVTHFNLKSNSKWEYMSGSKSYLEALTSAGFKYIMWGHNHQKENTKFTHEGNTIKILNAGSDYNKPELLFTTLR